MITKKDKIYEGKAKILYTTNDPDYLVAYFKDDATAFNNQKKGTIIDKGVINCAISAEIYKSLEKNKIPTHFVEQISEREMVVRKLTMLPLEVIMRNITAGSLSKRLGIEEGRVLKRPILEFCYKDDSLGDPFINEDMILTFDYCTDQELINVRNFSLRVNDFLKEYFDKKDIKLVDFKLEFGRFKGELYLGDEISPDSCRLWDKKTNEKLDKDRFRRDLGGVEEAYKTIYDKVVQK